MQKNRHFHSWQAADVCCRPLCPGCRAYPQPPVENLRGLRNMLGRYLQDPASASCSATRCNGGWTTATTMFQQEQKEVSVSNKFRDQFDKFDNFCFHLPSALIRLPQLQRLGPQDATDGHRHPVRSTMLRGWIHWVEVT